MNEEMSFEVLPEDDILAELDRNAVLLGYDSLTDLMKKTGGSEEVLRKIAAENNNYRAMEFYRKNFAPDQPYEKLKAGWDSEWQDYFKEDGTFDRRVHISSQFYVLEDESSHFIHHGDGKVYSSSLIRYLKSCYPNLKDLTLVAHWTRAEVSQLEDAQELIWQKEKDLRIINKTFTSRNSKYFEGIKFHLVDTKLFYDKSLNDLGKLIGMPKVDAKGNIEKMLEWWQKDTESFMEYALTDAKICCLFYEEILRFQKRLGLSRTVQTVGGIFEKGLYQRVHSKKNENRILGIGYQPAKEYVKDDKKDRSYYMRKIIPNVYKNDKFRAAYYGGRNETYLYGKYKDALIYDYDLASAYGSIMSIIPEWNMMQMDSFFNSEHLYDFLKQGMNILSHGFVDISHFKFKGDVKYPGFPIKDSGSIIFVKEGSTVATLQEFFVSFPYLEVCELKADVFPVVYDEEGNVRMSLIAEYANEIKSMRDEADKKGDSFTAQMAKLVNNSGYGKFAQGQSDKTGLDMNHSNPEAVMSSKVPPSSISSSYIASYITGLVRAEIAEYLHYCDSKDIVVGNVTTDGFTTLNKALSDSEVKSCGHLTNIMLELNMKYFDTPYILKLKHEGRGCIFIKTRCYTMLEKIGDMPLLSSITGIYQKKLNSPQDKIAMMNREYDSLYRFKNTKYLSERFPSIKDYVTDNAAFVKTASMVSFNWDYDFKRMPHNLSELDGRVTFASMPHDTIEQYRRVRDAYQNLCDGMKDAGGEEIGNKNKIVASSDWQDFISYFTFAEIICSNGLNKKIVKNMNLIIYCQSLKVRYGLGRHRISDIVGANVNNVKRWIKDTELYSKAMNSHPGFFESLIRDFDTQFNLSGVIIPL